LESLQAKNRLAFLNPFIVSAIKVIREMTRVNVVKKAVLLKRGKKSSGGVGIILDLKGDITGKVAYEFSREMTMRLSSMMLRESMIFTSSKDEYKQLLESAILELANIISGNATLYLEQNGFNCDITTPQFYLGKDVDLIPFYLMTIIIEFGTEYGNFTINLSLNNKKYF